LFCKFSRVAHECIRLEGGGYRRDHLRALARRVEVANHETRMMGSKTNLLAASRTIALTGSAILVSWCAPS